MAETIAKYLSTPGAAQTVAVLAGNGHVEYGLGMPGDVFRRLAVPYRVVSFQAVGQVTWGPGPGPPVAMCDYGRPLADYVWVTTEPPEEDKPKLGVTVEPPGKGEHGAKVEAVLKGSPAHKAGVKPCDVILAVNGEEVNSVGELRYVLSHKQMGDRVTVEVLREGKKASLEATLSPLPKKRGKGDELICPR
jgi:membrane-associated protease RseP (regulator of RpoE activity)